MTSFFEPREPQPPVDPTPQPYVPPIWTGPSRLELGSVASLELLLAKTDDVAVTLDNFRCYRNGFSMNLGFQVRPGATNDDDLGLPMHFRRSAPRLGIEFADGRRTGQRPNPMDVPKDESGIPTEPVIWPGGGGGGHERWDWRMWVWPLPPRGDLTIHFAWPDRGLEEAQHVVDGDLIVDAAERSIQLWDSGEVAPHPFAGGSSSQLLVGRRRDPEAPSS